MPITDLEATHLKTPISSDKHRWNFFYISQSCMFTFELSPKPRDIAGLINAWNYQAIGKSAHPIEMSLLDDSNVVLTNHTDQPMYLYAESHLVAVLSGRLCMSVPVSYFVDQYHTITFNQPNPVFVQQDTSVLQLKAYLYRKNGSAMKEGAYYTREETLVLPAGLYHDIGELVAALNSGISMRGARNGFIYNFEQKEGKLSIIASHRQPEPSILEIIPLSCRIGLAETSVLQLRTNKRLTFDTHACNII